VAQEVEHLPTKHEETVLGWFNNISDSLAFFLFYIIFSVSLLPALYTTSSPGQPLAFLASPSLTPFSSDFLSLGSPPFLSPKCEKAVCQMTSHPPPH
jgi:hypothetical protein